MPEEVGPPLITKYRPIDFAECYGNQLVVQKLAEVVKSPNRPHCYLFTGPSGIGKTTLARIIAEKVHATVDEIDAGTNSGIDFTKELVANSVFKPLELEAGKPNRLIILDECHALSRQAWSPLLKLTEEPPPYLFIAFCTTEPKAVIETIKTRSYEVALKPLHPNEIDRLITDISGIEGWSLANDVANGIISASEGSARRAISILQAGHSCQNISELAQVVAKVAADDSPEIELCKYLMSGKRDWRTVTGYLSRIQDHDSAITNISKYLAGSIARSEENQAHEIWILLQKFIRDASWDKRVQFYSAIGSILWGSIPF